MTDPNLLAADDHLGPHLVAGYVGGTLSLVQRRELERHLANCEACTEEIAAIARLRAARGGARRWLPVGVAAAAVLAGIVLLRPGRPAPDVVRDAGDERPIAVVVPLDGDTVAGTPTFVWRPVAGARTYRLTLTSEAGDSVWAATTTDTAVRTPADVALERTARYYWYVDALLPDGRSLSTGIREINTGP
jgi:anti-sigma factor RsiW